MFDRDTPLPVVPLQLNEFVEWAQSRLNNSAGRRCASGNCPLALFLADALGGTWRVDYNRVYAGGGAFCAETNQLYALPDWAYQFVLRIDNGGSRDLTGKDVLAVLDEFALPQAA